MARHRVWATLAGVLWCGAVVAAQWPAPAPAVIAGTDPYIPIAGAAVAPDPQVTYRVVIDGTRGAARPESLVPAVNVAGSILNDLGAAKVPASHGKVAVVFHGAAIDGLLDAAHFTAKFGRPNPNLPVLAALKQHGVELFVCGQNLAADRIDPKTLSGDVTVASDAFLVLITYQNRGYALMSF